MYEIKQELNHQTLEGWRVVHDYSGLKTNGSNYPELQQDALLPYGLQIAPESIPQSTDYEIASSGHDIGTATPSLTSVGLCYFLRADILPPEHDLTRESTPEYDAPAGAHPYEHSYQCTYNVFQWLPDQRSRPTTASFVTSVQQTYQGTFTPPSYQSESLDSRFCKIGKPSRFFTVGRVFMTLWTEPTKIKYRTDNQVTKAWLGTNVYSEIRRFVVIREGKGYSLCLPVHTYGGQGALKPRLNAEEHAAVYVKGTEPMVQKEEEMTVEPFPVIVENTDDNDCKVLHPMSRINLGKIYTVEHYSRVLKIGRVDPEHLVRLRQCAGVNSVPKTAPLQVDDKGGSQLDVGKGTSNVDKTGAGGNARSDKQKFPMINSRYDSRFVQHQENTESYPKGQPMSESKLQGGAKPFSQGPLHLANGSGK
ncbi:heterokaryon incompatibility protein [Rutstroemia sp. NJR-2017a WRK4]|nr:heterokaryon incompatibility protein [Rutstroemia sp. NJR-2017a WRK4]